MIVDIGFDNNGKQLYQVHESHRLVRKEMPKLASFSDDKHARRVLEAILPSTLNQKGDDDDEKPEGVDDSDLDIWSEDVEAAFEEVLLIIPKNGLNKIKISGRLCGRNELISDYILTKTGKYRSRKQVSSHIQVIKNLGQKLDIIQLINEGPVFHSEEERDENTRRFEEIFSKINLNKSLGLGDSVKKRPSLASTMQPPKKRRVVNVAIENFFISISDTMAANPILLTLQTSGDLKTLRLKENAVLSNRFPSLGDFSNSSVPIIHNMVRIQVPLQLPYNYTLDGLKTNFLVKLDTVGGLDASHLAIFTSVYSFGHELMKLNEPLKLNENVPYLPKFWSFFLNELISKPSTTSDALRGITIKQIIYESSAKPLALVPKQKIKALLLWEFAGVLDLKDAVTLTARLVLPDPPAANAHNVIPQLVMYQPPEPVLFSTPNTASSMLSMAPNTASTMASVPDLVPPQLNVQRKFQSLQQQMPLVPPSYPAYAMANPPPGPGMDFVMMPDPHDYSVYQEPIPFDQFP